MDRIKKLPLCFLCKRQFAFPSTVGFKSEDRRPVVVGCGHSVCHQCLISELQVPGDTIQCLTCQLTFTASSNYSPLKPHSEFPVNYFLLCLSHCTSNAPDDSSIAFNKSKLVNKLTKSIVCDECSERKADFNCRDCKAPYCSPCFTRVHQSARAFRGHVRADLVAPLERDSFSEKCSDHPDEAQTFWCDQCHLTVCPRCIFSKHQAHDKVQPLQEKNEGCLGELMEAHVKASNILERMKATKKTVTMEARSQEEQDGPAHSLLMDHFSRLHGLLVLRQQQLLSQLTQSPSPDPHAPSSYSHSVKPLVNHLEHGIQSVTSLLESSNYVLMNKESLMKTAPYPLLVDKLHQVLTTPCHLVINQQHPSTPSITFDERIFDAVRCHGSVDNNAGEGRYKLVSEEDLGPEHVAEPVGKQLTIEMLVNSLKLKSSSSHSSSSESSVQASSIEAPALSDQPYSYYDELLPGSKIRATISHSISPSEFYIHRVDFKKKMKEIDSQIATAMKMNKRVQDVRINQLYIVRFDNDSGWYRGRILEKNGDTVRVHYIDFGNRETVNLNSVRWMPKELALIEPLAIPCCLHNCHPRGKEWDPRALTSMLSIMGRDIQLVVKKKTPSKLYVNAYQTNMQQGSYSIAESLVFLGCANTVSHRNVEEKEVGENIRRIEPNDALPDGSVTQVRVVHIDNPSQFYVQDLKCESTMLHIRELLQNICNQKGDKMVVYCPNAGMLVSAKCKRDDLWYRAEVIDKPLPKTVIVQYIDFGFIEQINWQRIKLLPHQFFKYKRQCYRCCLLDVAPVKEKSWSKCSSDVFSRSVVNLSDCLSLTMVTHSVKEGSHQVVLHKEMGGSDSTCINTLLVNMKAAVSTGVNSKLLQFHRGLYEHAQQGVEDTRIDALTSGGQNECLEETGLEGEVVTTGTQREMPGEPEEEVPTTNTSLPSSSATQEPSESSLNQNLKVPIEIVNICSPSEFYVTYLKLKNKISLMIEDLQVFYNEKHESVVSSDAKEGSVCVVQNESGQWCRAVVQQADAQQYHVRLLDQGERIRVEKVYYLNESFIHVMDGAIQCHLGGLKPPLNNDWPLTATDELREVARNNYGKLFITPMGKPNKGSWAVELFSQESLAAKAFEPMSVKWTSFNNLLRKKGLALSDGTTHWDVEESFIQVGTKTSVGMNHLTGSLKYFGLQHKEKVEETWCEVGETSSSEEVVPHVDKVDLVVVRDCLPGAPDVLPRNPPEAPVMPVVWPPPLPFDSLNFIASATNVNYQASIFIQDFHRSVITLKRLETELQSHCKLSEPSGLDQNWSLGDTCIARYHLDKKWYRAVIKQVTNENTFSVSFVDYGNVEDCHVGDLRKKPLMTDVPIQGRFCKMRGVTTASNSRTWPIQDLDKIHATVVDKHCHVKLHQLPDGNYEIENMILPNGENLQDHLVKTGLALFIQDPSETVGGLHQSKDGGLSESGDEMVVEMETKLGEMTILGAGRGEGASQVTPPVDVGTETCYSVVQANNTMTGSNLLQEGLTAQTTGAAGGGPPVPEADDHGPQESLPETDDTLSDLDEYEPEYRFFDTPDINSTFTVDIGAILAPNKVSFQIIDCQDYAISASRESFLALEEDMQSKAGQQPLLKNLEPGTPCCAMFSSDNKWYRGKILQVCNESDMVLVQYVDYGNVEKVSSNQIRKMKDHWMFYDVQGLEALLHNVASTSQHETSLLSAMIHALIGEKLFAKVMSHDPFTVELYSDSGLSTVAYQKLIDNGLLQLIEDTT